jgi:hypothetical protein
MLVSAYLKLLAHAEQLREEDRGEMITTLVVVLGFVAAAVAVIAILRPAIESLAQRIVSAIGG